MSDNVWLTDGGMLPFVTWPLYNRNYWHNAVRCTLSLVDGVNVAPAPMQSIGEWALNESHTMAIIKCEPIPPHVPTSEYQIEIVCTCDIKDYQGNNISRCRFATTIQLRDITNNTIVMSATEYSVAGTTVYFPTRAITDTYFYGFLGDDDSEFGDDVMWAGIWFDYRDTTDGTYVRIGGDPGIRGDGPGFSRETMRNTYGVDIRPRNGEFDPDVDDPNEDDDGYSGPGGGDGNHDHSTEDIGIPSLPTLSATGTGFVTLYKTNLAQMRAVAAELWTSTLWDVIKNLFTDPLQFIIGVTICPFTPDLLQGGYYPTIGNILGTDVKLSTPLQVVSNQYKEIDCGSISLEKYYGSALDYSPYEKIQIHLPYCGTHDLDVDEVMGSTIGVKYHCDCLSGACVAFVTITNSETTGCVRYQFTGNVLSHIPITERSFDEVVKSMAVMGAAAAGTLAAGAGAGGAVGEGISAGEGGETDDVSKSSNAGNVMTVKPNVMRSGAISTALGLLAVQKPFITRTIPRQSLPQNYSTYEGYPSNIRESLGSLSGFTKIYSIRPSGFTCTTEELDEIVTLLKQGVIL